MKIKKGSLSELILLAMEKTVEGYVRVEDFAYHHYRYHHGVPELKQSTLAEALRRLRLAGYIEKQVNEDKIILKLTQLGREALGKDNSPWDGKFRIVIFDIPEKKRVVRNLFRRKLKEWEFKNWQRSVLITKRNVTEKLRKLISELEIDDWVAVIESDDPTLFHITLDDRTT